MWEHPAHCGDTIPGWWSQLLPHGSCPEFLP
uniref:Uncharacterized protein n=1 Tax=Trichinella nativa TaxID=6335 RepID=A0A0V1J752_9BILA